MTNHQTKCKHARPRIQREFLSWFFESRHLSSTPISISKHTKQSIGLAFTDATTMISATLSSWEINVSFHWEGIDWDFLTCFEAIPAQKRGWYVCSLCDDPEGDVYSTREVLWEVHLFEPFLEWVNGTLTKAPWIEVYGSVGETTAARLLVVLPDNQQPNTSENAKTSIIANPLYKAK